MLLVRIHGKRGVHTLLKAYIAPSGRLLVDYRETKTLRTRSVEAAVARLVCASCKRRVARMAGPKKDCPDCDALRIEEPID